MRAVVILLVSLSLFAQSRYPLTPREISEGWLLIYDGESAYGWGLEGGALWATDPDGVLSVRTGESGDMVLSAVFGDYQLTCEMRTPNARGSGTAGQRRRHPRTPGGRQVALLHGVELGRAPRRQHRR